jgi:hypothetical protein
MRAVSSFVNASSTAVRCVVAITGTLTLAGLSAAPTKAQSDRPAVSFVPSILYTVGRFGDDNPEYNGELGFNIGVQVRLPIGVAVEGVWQPTKVDSPHFDDRGAGWH